MLDQSQIHRHPRERLLLVPLLASIRKESRVDLDETAEDSGVSVVTREDSPAGLRTADGKGYDG
jgi:hypothetical protein